MSKVKLFSNYYVGNEQVLEVKGNDIEIKFIGGKEEYFVLVSIGCQFFVKDVFVIYWLRKLYFFYEICDFVYFCCIVLFLNILDFRVFFKEKKKSKFSKFQYFYCFC